MGAELFRKYVTSSVISFYRSVVRHPFLVGMILFMFWMYRLFPLLFSVLVSSSPVILSTAVLLGTLLSFGQPNIPEIEKEPESDHAQIRKLESKDMGHTEAVGSFHFEETNGSRIEVADKSFEIDKVNDDDDDKVNDNDNTCVKADKTINLVEDGLLEFGEVKSDLDEGKVVLGSHYSPLRQLEDEHIVLESDKLWEGSADPLNSNSGMLWKGVEGNNGGGDDEEEDGEDDDEDDDGSESGDSGSDLAESSSPDASMADIIPMLDELHPLLSEEQETHQPSHVSHDGTDAVSQHSLESSDTSSESNDDDTGVENHESLKIGDDEDDDKESEHVDKEDETRSAITWTEDDQKNLMNLGTSELERNRRLENLIARRRARKIMRMQAERNLIDLEIGDLPWNIPPISTSRNNPFDYDANDNIPGSAPSVLLQRRNPFDLPYDSSEEKPDLVGDAFQQEFATFQPKEPFFRRHESFNVGPSVFGAARSERQETKLKPYFVPERSFSTFQRQFSGLSDSKASSVPDTESASSDTENKDHVEEEDEHSLEAEHASEMDEHVSNHVSHARPYFVPEHVASDETRFASFQRRLSEVSDSKVSSESDSESVSSAGEIENKEHIDLSLEPDLISMEDHEHASEIIEHVSDHVTLLSESFEEDGGVDPRGPDEAEISVESVINQQELHSSGSSLSSSDGASEQVIYNEKEGNEMTTRSVSETVESATNQQELHSSGSSLSSSDETVEQISNEKEGNEVATRSISESVESATNNQELHRSGSDLSSSDKAVDQIYNEKEGNEVVRRSVSESVGSVTNQLELHSSGSSLSSSDEASEQIYNEKEGDEVAVGSVSETEYFLDRGSSIERSEIDVTSLVESQPNEPVYDLSPRSVTRNLSSSSISMDLHKDGSFQHIDDHNPSSGSAPDVKWNSTESSSETRDAQTQVPFVPDNEEHVSVVDTFSISLPNKPVLEAEDVVLDLGASHELEEVQVSSSNSQPRSHESFHQEHVMSQPDEDSSLGGSGGKPLAEDSEELQAHDLEHVEVALPSNGEEFTEVVHGETYENHSPTHGEDISQPQEEVPFLDTSVNEPSEDNHEVLQVQVISNISDNLQIQEPDVLEVTDIESKAQEIPADASDTHSIEGNLDDVDEIKEINEALLVELDAVGDFSVKDFGSTLSEMKEDPDTSEHDLENKGIAEEDSYNNDLESNLNEMKQESHDSEHDLETSHFVEEVSYSRDLGSAFDEMKQEYDIETKCSGDEDYDSKDLGTPLFERKQDLRVLDHDLETMISGDEETYSKDLDPTLDEMKQDPRASDHDLETEDIEHDPHALDHDLETKHSEEIKQDSHALVHELETKHFEDVDSHSKDATLDEMKQNPHDSSHYLETKHSENDDSYSKDPTLDETKQNPHDSSHDLEAKHSGDEDFYSKDATLDETKQEPHALDLSLETKRHDDDDSHSKDATLDEMKQNPHMDGHDLETKHSGDEDSYAKDATLIDMKQDPHDSGHDLETKHSGDEDSNSKDLGSSLDEMNQDPLETNQYVDEDSYPEDLDTTFSYIKEGTHALENRLETFYSVDENFYSKHVESAFNEMKQDLHASDQGLEIDCPDETEVKMDVEVIKSQNENDISTTKVEGTLQVEASGSKLGSDANEVALTQENESTTSLANLSSTTRVNHGTKNASATSNTDKNEVI